MSDFSGNPFADTDDVNPFADPAVTAVTTNTQAEEYNPFADQPPPTPEPIRIPPPPSKQEMQTKNKRPSGPSAPPAPTPAVIEAQQYPQPPAYTQPPGIPEDDEFRRREEDIASKEAALEERERNLQRLGPQRRENNFPPLPSGCPIKPCFYHDISAEIPPSQRLIVRALLGLWIYTISLLTYNLIVAIAGAIAAGTKHDDSYLTTMGFAIAYFILFIPGSMVCWYIPVYRAYRSDSSLAYMWFFFVFCFQIISYAFNCIGFPKTGGCGFWNGAVVFDEGAAVGAMFIICAILWALAIPFSVFLFLRVHRYYRSSGASLQKAQQEAYAAAASNKTLQRAGKKAVVTAATNKTVQQGVATGLQSAAQSAVAQ
ncbi:secretory carrier-associated membrane protein 1-like [Dysidea avara]|uniref:secretory carrier-associated membrane protein 1-like n=1 Tax=Dysidea avara TaxID=196820 RepID=UPI0033230DCE